MDARPTLRCEEKRNRKEGKKKVNGEAEEWRGKGRGSTKAGRREQVEDGETELSVRVTTDPKAGG